MSHRRRHQHRRARLALLALVFACSGDDALAPASPIATPDPTTEGPTPTGSAAISPASPASETTRMLATQGNQIRFDPEEIEAPAGRIALQFTNTATADILLHNVVVVRSGTAEAVGLAALQAGEARGYVPESPDVLGATTLLAPGQTGTLQLTLEPGTYEYICTFPGHYLLMRGTLRVTAG